MATKAIHAVTADVGHSRSTRFMERMNARKGTFNHESTPQGPAKTQLAPAATVADMLIREAGNHPAMEEDKSESFLQVYLKAFSAARQ